MPLNTRRLHKELEDMANDHSCGVHATIVDPRNMAHLQGHFKGPPDSPYAGGTYHVEINLPENYPFSPPKMRFITKVWHPNISSQTGAICLDTLATKWSPVLTIKTALISLQSLLLSPEPDDPQDAIVAQQLKTNKPLFEKTAREWTAKYAMDDKYKGYKKEVVDNVCAMGFKVEAVVKALEEVGVGKDKVPTDAQADEVLNKLLG